MADEKLTQLNDAGSIVATDILYVVTAPGSSPVSQKITWTELQQSATTFVENEVVSGSVTTFVLANTPITGSVRLFAQRNRLYPTTDYTISGAIITTTLSYSAGDLLADYRK